MIGQLLIGRYLILKELGVGGFSETHLAIDKYLLDQPVCVVKRLELSPSSTISIERAKQLFETEARVLDRLGRHSSQIPTLFAYCHEQGHSYQVEEYIEGENLENWFNQGRYVSSEAAIELLKKVLSILEYVHSYGVIHRDIKPSNLIQRKQDGNIVLIDFGAACDLSERRWKWQSNHEKAITIGTPGYMPIEQQNGHSRYNSDLYALGITVIQLLTGVHPQQFQIDPVTKQPEWRTHLEQQSIDPKLVAILEGMVQEDARLRYQSATEVLTALETLSLAERRAPQRQRKTARRKQRYVDQRTKIQVILKPVWMVLLATVMGGGYCLFRNSNGKALLTQIDMTDSQADIRLLPLHHGPFAEEFDRRSIKFSQS